MDHSQQARLTGNSLQMEMSDLIKHLILRDPGHQQTPRLHKWPSYLSFLGIGQNLTRKRRFGPFRGVTERFRCLVSKRYSSHYQNIDFSIQMAMRDSIILMIKPGIPINRALAQATPKTSQESSRRRSASFPVRKRGSCQISYSRQSGIQEVLRGLL
jgi:hypothetical protein